MAPRPFEPSILKYRPLDPTCKEIRLLEVYPAQSIDEPIRSRLIYVPLTSDVPYIGLSLLYGNAAETEVIHVNGQPLYVPRSIEQALRNVRTACTQSEVADYFVSTAYPGPSSTPTETRRSGDAQLGAPTLITTSTDDDDDMSTISEFSTRGDSSTPDSSGPSHSGDYRGWKAAGKWLRNAFQGGRNKRYSWAQHSKSQPLRIWLDALCTDHEDAEEMSHRRSHMALAYREAKFVVGWLGGKEEDAEVAVQFFTSLAVAAPPELGDPKHRKEHPEQYGPIMEFLAPMEKTFVVPPGTRAEDHPGYIACQKFFQRPYFCNNWILSELAFAKFPVFLIGDMFVSWLQMLRCVFITEELIDKGSIYYPDEWRRLLNFAPLDSVYFFLEEYDRRRQAQLERERRERREKKSHSHHDNGELRVDSELEDARTRRRRSRY